MPIAIDKFPKQAAVPYEDIRNQLQDGDVLLCSGSGVFSAMIQQATKSVWSHVAFVLRLDSIDRVMVLESVEPIGVRTVRLSKYLEDYANDNKPYPGGLAILRHKEFNASIEKNKLTELAKYAVDQFGYPYDIDEIAKIAARILASTIPFTKRQLKKIESDREFICSEYVARCYAAVGLQVQWNQLGFVAPSDFAADSNFDLIAVLKEK